MENNNEKEKALEMPEEAKPAEFMVLGNDGGAGLAWRGVGESPDPGIQNATQTFNRTKPASKEPQPLYGKDFE